MWMTTDNKENNKWCTFSSINTFLFFFTHLIFLLLSFHLSEDLSGFWLDWMFCRVFFVVFVCKSMNMFASRHQLNDQEFVCISIKFVSNNLEIMCVFVCVQPAFLHQPQWDLTLIYHSKCCPNTCGHKPKHHQLHGTDLTSLLICGLI